MKSVILSLALIAATLCSAFFAAPAQAQATRTWVSGVGDDVNPCSRTAPCKTFAGAISKTAAGGEINCLDPGGYGAVTITKSLTIDCRYTEGGALAGGNGIVINAGVNDIVRLSGLDIFGVNPPSNGVRFIAGAALYIENVRIKQFKSANSWGVSFQPSGASELHISNAFITDNGNPADPATAGGGILIQPTGAGGSARVVIRNTQLVNNSQGLRADTTGSTNAAPIKVSIQGSSADHNTFAGFTALVAPGTSPINMMVDSSAANYNGGTGFIANGVGAVIRMGRSVATGNGAGTGQTNSGVVESYGTNQIRGNTSDGTRTLVGQE
jgi:hypothetical protein